MELYLKAHPGGPAASEFDWGTGETPRRSARISEKAKAAPPRESEPPKKRSRKTSASKQDNKEKEAAPEGTEETKGDTQDEQKTGKDDANAETKKDVVKEAAAAGEAKDGEESHLPNDAEKATGAEQESSKVTSVEKNVSGSGPKNEKETLQEQPPVEGEKNVGPVVQGEADKANADGKKFEVEEKNIISANGSEREKEQKEAARANKEQTGSGTGEVSKKVEEVIENGSNGNEDGTKKA